MRRRALLLAGAFLPLMPRLALAASPPRGFTDDPRVLAYIDYLQETHAFSPQELRVFFSRLSFNPKILRIMDAGAAATGKRPAVYWHEYRKQRLAPRDIARGAAFFRRHAKRMHAAHERYGVPGHVITAILGIETQYGKNTGRYGVAQTLATLAFGHSTRAQEFKDELTEFLLYAREARLDPVRITGSYAGAIGMPQFMPSSIRKHAVNADGDARADLFDPVDTIPSIGNFLQNHGWRRDIAVITYRVKISPANAKRLIALTEANEYRATMTAAELAQLGAHSAAPADGAERYVFVDLPDRFDAEYRLGTQNFYAITRYNKSFKYAAAVTDLAAAIKRRV